MIEENKNGFIITAPNLVNETQSEGRTTPRDNTHHLTTNFSESSGFGDGPAMGRPTSTKARPRIDSEA